MAPAPSRLFSSASSSSGSPSRPSAMSTSGSSTPVIRNPYARAPAPAPQPKPWNDPNERFGWYVRRIREWGVQGVGPYGRMGEDWMMVLDSPDFRTIPSAMDREAFLLSRRVDRERVLEWRASERRKALLASALCDLVEYNDTNTSDFADKLLEAKVELQEWRILRNRYVTDKNALEKCWEAANYIAIQHDFLEILDAAFRPKPPPMPTPTEAAPQVQAPQVQAAFAPGCHPGAEYLRQHLAQAPAPAPPAARAPSPIAIHVTSMFTTPPVAAAPTEPPKPKKKRRSAKSTALARIAVQKETEVKQEAIDNMVDQIKKLANESGVSINRALEMMGDVISVQDSSDEE